MESNCLPLPQVESQNQRIQPQTIPVQGAEMIKVYTLGAFPVVGPLDVPDALLASQFNYRVQVAPGPDEIAETVNSLNPFRFL